MLFEPCKELYELTTVYGIFNARYVEINDYNNIQKYKGD